MADLWGTRVRPVKPRSQQGFRCWRPRAEIILQVVTQKVCGSNQEHTVAAIVHSRMLHPRRQTRLLQAAGKLDLTSVLGKGTTSQVAEKLARACSTVEERPFRAAKAVPNQ